MSEIAKTTYVITSNIAYNLSDVPVLNDILEIAESFSNLSIGAKTLTLVTAIAIPTLLRYKYLSNLDNKKIDELQIKLDIETRKSSQIKELQEKLDLAMQKCNEINELRQVFIQATATCNSTAEKATATMNRLKKLQEAAVFGCGFGSVAAGVGAVALALSGPAVILFTVTGALIGAVGAQEYLNCSIPANNQKGR